MKYCSRCGNQMADDMNFCQKCGTPFTNNNAYAQANTESAGARQSKSQYFHEQAKRVPPKTWYILGAIFIPYITFFVALFKKPFNTKRANTTFLIVCAIWSLIIIPSALSNQTSENNGAQPSPSTTLVTSSQSNVSTPVESTAPISSPSTSVPLEEISFKGISDEILLKNFIAACELIGLNISEIKKVETAGTWVGGDILSLTYQSTGVDVYVNGDKTINSINVGQTRVYKQGLTPLQISDYLVSLSMVSNMQVQAEKTVKSALNYPDTADFSWLGWGYGRAKDIYMVSGTVTAQNAFGVKEELSFYIEYRVNGNRMTTEYFVLDGKALVGKDSVVEEQEREREEISTASNIKAGSIELIDGVLGEYGEKIFEDGYEYIVYNIPTGTYIVTTDMNFCVVYVEKVKGVKNSDGYIEHDVISECRFEKGVKSLEVTVGDNEWVTITANAKVVFTLNE